MVYSGHGSQMTDRHGDEPSGLDETIVPHDAARKPRHNRNIVVDEIYDWLLRVNEKIPYVIDLVLGCLRRNGAWTEAAPEAASGEVVYEEGDYVAFRVTNNHTEEEVGAAGPLGVCRVDEFEVGFVDERRGVERVVALPRLASAMGQGAQLVVDQGKQRVEGVGVAFPHGFEQLRHRFLLQLGHGGGG